MLIIIWASYTGKEFAMPKSKWWSRTQFLIFAGIASKSRWQVQLGNASCIPFLYLYYKKARRDYTIRAAILIFLKPIVEAPATGQFA